MHIQAQKTCSDLHQEYREMLDASSDTEGEYDDEYGE